jgi:hypothetical protein
MRRFRHFFLLVFLLAACPVPGLAQALGLSPEGQAALEKGEALQREAESLRETADRQLAGEKALCARKILQNDCLDRANARHLDVVREARRLREEGLQLEYTARMEERAKKQAAREAEAARKAEILPQRQEDTEARRRAKEAKQEKKRAKKEEAARKGQIATEKKRSRQKSKD